MLVLYRRHTNDCEEALKKRGLDPGSIRAHFRCRCPIWLRGTDSRGKWHRETLATNDPEIAEDKKRSIDRGVAEVAAISVRDATDKWISALKAAKRSGFTLKNNHEILTAQIIAYADGAGYRYLSDFTLPVCEDFVGTWELASTTHRARLGLLRSFFKWAAARRYIGDSPATAIITPRERHTPTLPYSPAEESVIFEASKRFGESRHFGGFWAIRPATARALMLVLRWTGLRISDALQFDPRKISTMSVDERDIRVYRTHQAKTGEPVLCPIPDDVAAEVERAPRVSDDFTFLDREFAKRKTDDARKEFLKDAANNYAFGYLGRVGRLAGVTNVRPHRFRDTFAVRLLESGTPLEEVSALLGHTSIKTTEKHYAPWVRSRQVSLIRNVMRTWHKD